MFFSRKKDYERRNKTRNNERLTWREKYQNFLNYTQNTVVTVLLQADKAICALNRTAIYDIPRSFLQTRMHVRRVYYVTSDALGTAVK